MSAWKLATVLASIIFFGLSVRWSYLDNSPPSWDQGHYLHQATILHDSFTRHGFTDFLKWLFNMDRGRVPLLSVIAQPGFLLFGPSLDVAVISLNFAWFVLAWSMFGIARQVAASTSGDKAGFCAFVLFGLYPLTTMLAHNYLVELLLVTFISVSIYSLLLLHQTKNKKWSVLAGISIGLGLLTKVTFPAFILPAFCLLIYRNIKNSTARTAFTLFFPAILLSFIISGPYYLYNFKPILQLTVDLSSHHLSQLYGFGGAFNIGTIVNFLLGVVTNVGILVAIFCCIATLFFRSNRSNAGPTVGKEHRKDYTPTIVMALWFVIPFLLVIFGEIKEARYLYPALVPIFVFAGVAAARNSVSKLGATLMASAYMLALPGYLYANNLMSARTAGLLVSGLKIDAGLTADAPPDQSDWGLEKLVRGMADSLDAHQESKKVLFLGGYRYYHPKALEYYGLIEGGHLQYLTLPHYRNPPMTLQEALEFIEESAVSGVILKSGENSPPFLIRLDPGIIFHLRADPRFTAKDMNIEQPDGSRFTLFVKRSPRYVSLQAVSAVVGSWKVMGGLASIAAIDGGGLAITTETGLKGSATIRNGAVYVDEWKISGKITSDLNSIHWSNGSIWNKYSSEKSFGMGIKKSSN